MAAWTQFWDMHSGGGCKEPPYESIYIEAPEDEARLIFYNRFGHNPARVTCTCCGDDYSVSESPELWIATAFHRNIKCLDQTYNEDEKRWEPEQPYEDRPKDPGDNFSFGTYQTLIEYEAREDVLVIRADAIKPDERKGSIPDEGYVWVD